jgi:ankyrin repeat protein
VAGSVAAVKTLLAGGAAIDGDPSLPLHWVARGGSLAVLKALLEHGCDVHAVNASGETPLDVACSAEVAQNAQALLFFGASSQKLPPYLYKLLESAIDRGALDEVRSLIGAGVDVQRKRMGATGRNALQAAIEKGHPRIVELLAAHGCSFDRKITKTGRTPFMLAVDRGQVDMARLAVQKGVTLDTQAMADWVMSSVREGDGTVAVVLCRDVGLDPNAAPFVVGASSAIHAAAAVGQVAVLEDLCAAGADCNAVVGGSTPLVEAIMAGQPEAARFLLDTAKADVFARSAKSGFASIHWAADCGSAEMLELLLDAQVSLPPRKRPLLF